jgi:hypothetical protein
MRKIGKKQGKSEKKAPKTWLNDKMRVPLPYRDET